MDLIDYIELEKVDNIVEYKNNPKEHPPEQIDMIATSIAEYGFDQPIVIDKDNIIIKGHGRFKASKKLGLEEVPVIKREDLDKAKAKASRIMDNKSKESEWNMETLWLELETIDMDEFETGFTMEELREEGFEGFDEESMKKNIYTDKVESPQYKPMGIQPQIDELFDAEKFERLIAKIEESDLPDKQKWFLKMTAYRHIIFDYENIAEYYCHASPEMQELMEELALIIVDFDDAIEQGFGEFNANVLEKRAEDEEAGGNDEG